MKKILTTASQTIVAIILMLLPFFPITENFFPPENQVNNQTFLKYILLCLGIIVIGFGLISFLKKSNPISGWLLFAIGMTAIFPLHLGPPREDALLLIFSSIEKFRYGMLLISVLLLVLAGLKIWEGTKTTLIKITIAFLAITALLNIWDNFSSFMFSSNMQDWVSTGKNADDFFKQFDYNIVWRTMARIFLYISAVLMAFALVRQTKVKKWQFALLTIFCLIGIAFCGLFFVKGFQYYFPFMVPAIALAPSYWIGLALLSNKKA